MKNTQDSLYCSCNFLGSQKIISKSKSFKNAKKKKTNPNKQNLNSEIKKNNNRFLQSSQQETLPTHPLPENWNQRLPPVTTLHQVGLAQRHSHLAE